jgi:branched-subunit amino acid transport protein
MTTWIAIVGAGLITFLMRLSFIQLMGRAPFPTWLRTALGFVPAAVLAAIVVPDVVIPKLAHLDVWSNPRLWAALVAGAVAWRTRSVIATLTCGMSVLWLIQWLVG